MSDVDVEQAEDMGLCQGMVEAIGRLWRRVKRVEWERDQARMWAQRLADELVRRGSGEHYSNLEVVRGFDALPWARKT